MVEQMGIPIKNYFDPEIHQLEKKVLFKNRPNYLGAKNMLKKEGDYRVVERLNDSKILTLKNSSYTLLDNVCAHRQAKMLSGAGNSHLITCPYHRWSFEHDSGKCVNAPLCKNNKVDASLRSTPIQHWKNLFFNGERNFGQDVNNFYLIDEMEIDKMVYKKTVSENLNYNWKHFIDIFGENYHIPFIHPGFNFFLDLNTMDWVEEEEYHAQMVKPKSSEFLKKHKTTPVYNRWIDLLLGYYNNQLPEYAGLLIMYYPNIMIECYPLYMTISTIHPTGPESSVMYCDYFHHEDVFYSRHDIVEAAEAASEETMLEDSHICEWTAEGRKFLYEQDRDSQNSFDTPYEDGLSMFHRYYHRKMNASARFQDVSNSKRIYEKEFMM